MDEQPLNDVDRLPPLSDHEPYFDSLDERDTSRNDVSSQWQDELKKNTAEDCDHHKPVTIDDIPPAEQTVTLVKHEQSCLEVDTKHNISSDQPVNDEVIASATFVQSVIKLITLSF